MCIKDKMLLRGIPESEVDIMIDKAKKLISEGADPYVIVEDIFKLEPEYIFDLI